jgi:tRNA(Ile)-lysidine synthetase-like protein
VSRSSDEFGPEWLVGHLEALLPGYPDVSLCVALSGGVDSTALLAALAIGVRSSRASSPEARAMHLAKARAIHLPKIRALHVDHGLRPASKQWATQCRLLARRLRVPLKVLTTKVERRAGESLEAAAREARYRLLASALGPGEILLTAHHGDDQLETVLLQLFRGSGLPGIAAMPALAPFAQGWLARPLLSRSRAELEGWLALRGLPWVEDDSNIDESLDRNYLRLRILPLIRARWPGAAVAVGRSARHAAEAQTLLDSLARADVERASYGESISVKTLRALPPNRRRNALRFWIMRAGYLVPDTRRLEEIAGPLLEARRDANPFVEWRGREGPVHAAAPFESVHPGTGVMRSKRMRSLRPQHSQGRAVAQRSRGNGDQPAPVSVRAQRNGDLLSIHSAEPTPRLAPRASQPSGIRQSGLTGASMSIQALWFWRSSSTFDLPNGLGQLELQPNDRGPIDLEALPEPLAIRQRVGGERLSPHRGGPRRTLKNLLQEARVPAPERALLPLLFSITAHDEKLVAVADLLLDETAQATTATRRRGRLLWKKSSQ